MNIWRLPDILVVHLVRHRPGSRIETLVHVPLGEIDFTPHLDRLSPSNTDNRYRLYAVSNHLGS